MGSELALESQGRPMRPCWCVPGTLPMVPTLCGLSGYQGPPGGVCIQLFLLPVASGWGWTSFSAYQNSWLFILPALWGPPNVSCQRCSLCRASWWAPDCLCRVLVAVTLSFWGERKREKEGWGEHCISKLFITCEVVCKQCDSIITSSRICKSLVVRSQCVFNFLQGTWYSLVLLYMSWLGHNMWWIVMMLVYSISVFTLFKYWVNFLPRIEVCGQF